MQNWTILISFICPNQAQMAIKYLESKGFEVKLRDEMTAQIVNFFSNAIGGVKIMIREKYYESGIEALKSGGFLAMED